MVILNHNINALVGVLVFYVVLGLKVSFLIYTGQVGELINPTIVSSDFTHYVGIERLDWNNYRVVCEYLDEKLVSTLPVIPNFTLCGVFNLHFVIYKPYTWIECYSFTIYNLPNNLHQLEHYIFLLKQLCQWLNTQVEDSAAVCVRLGLDDFDAEDYMMNRLDIAKAHVRGFRVLEQIMRQYNPDYVSGLPVCHFED